MIAMIGQYMQIGDEVVIEIPKEIDRGVLAYFNGEEMLSLCNGARATVIEFSDFWYTVPGTQIDRIAAELLLEDGRVCTLWIGFLRPTNPDEYVSRIRAPLKGAELLESVCRRSGKIPRALLCIKL